MLPEISDDVNRYLNLEDLIVFSTVSTSTFYRGLNNMIYYRFIPNENGDELLRKLENEEEVKLSDIKGSSEINYANGHNNTLFFRVSYNYKAEMMKLMIKMGVNVNKAVVDGDTPLSAALHGGNIKMIKLFIKSGADVNLNSINNYGDTLLHSAAGSNSTIEIVKLLLKEGGLCFNDDIPYGCLSDEKILDVNNTNSEGDTPLFNAVRNDKKDIAKLLLNIGYDINHINDEGLTPLFEAAYEDNLEMVKFLIKEGANVDLNHINSWGESLLSMPMEHNNTEMINLFKEKGTYK